jgi:uncharacterized protein YndB with AHSA1/START domain
MTDFGMVTDGGTVRFERELPAPIDRVWQYLVQSELRARWFAAGTIEPREGGGVTLVFNNSRLAPAEESVPQEYARYEGHATRGRVVRWEPPRLLAFIWEEDEPGEDSEVTCELEDLGGRTRFVLTHRGLAPALRADVAGGWHLHFDVLEDLLAGRPRRPYWSRHAALRRDYAERLSA